MTPSTLKGGPMLVAKFKVLATRMRQVFKFGKAAAAAKKAQNYKNASANNNYEFENNNNNNNEISKFALLHASEMAQNAANEWLLQQAAISFAAATTTATAAEETMDEMMEPHVICLQTEAGHFYWNSTQVTQAEEQQQLSGQYSIDWK